MEEQPGALLKIEPIKKLLKCASRWSLLLNAGLKLTCKSKEFMAVAFFLAERSACHMHRTLASTGYLKTDVEASKKT